MFYSKVSNNQFLLRLELGDKIVETIQFFCEKNSIDNAWLSGLGSVENPTLAHYKITNKKYSEKKLSGIFEILSLTGNIALFENKPLTHIHVVISDEEMKAFGGHLVKGTTSATLEVMVTKLDTQIMKEMDKEVGLKLFKLSDKM